MIHFYDFEVFKYDWMIVIINPYTRTETVIINDVDKLQAYYDAHKNEIWVGFNSRHYDQYIFKGILCDFDPKEINDFIIVAGNDGWQFSNLLREIPIINYDVMPNPPIGLKTLEGFMGSMIKETGVSFDIDRPLTKEELDETVKYCRHDVEQTINVFLETKERFDASMGLVKEFKLPLSFISKTEAQLTAEILDCQSTKFNDEWDIYVLDTIRLDKYKFIADWFMSRRNQNYAKKYEVDVCDTPHTFAWGGLHGAKPKYHAKGCLLHVDVGSYYPTILIKYGLMSRASRNPWKYKQIYDTRMELKHAGKKKEQEPYKKVMNTISGAMKDKFNKAYDPRNNNLMCINGQLMLLDLLEKLEPHCEVIQSNTDGLIIKIDDTDEAFDIIDDICYEWEHRTGMSLGFDYITEIWQKDVNNYVFVDRDGKVERKGAYVKELSAIDYDLPIINKAMLDFMIKGISVEETINSCTELKMFQKIVKISSKYSHGLKNPDFKKVKVENGISKRTHKPLYKKVEVWAGGGTVLNDKTFRVFASNIDTDGGIYKVKSEGAKPEKFANTPEKCFIDNDDINGKSVPSELDRQWYIDLANERLKQYGVL